MHRIDADAHVANQFSDGDPGTGQPGTRVDAAWANAVQEEIAGLIEACGIALVKGTNTQLVAALLTPVWVDITVAGTGWNVGVGGIAPPKGYKDSNGVVHLRGIMETNSVTPQNLVMTLPAALRPVYSQFVMGRYSNSPATELPVMLEIQTTGNVLHKHLGTVTPTASDELWLAGVSFSVVA